MDQAKFASRALLAERMARAAIERWSDVSGSPIYSWERVPVAARGHHIEAQLAAIEELERGGWRLVPPEGS